MNNGILTLPATIMCKRIETLETVPDEFPAWGDMEIVQTEPGAVCLDGMLAKTGDFILSHVMVDRKFHHNGHTPLGYRTFTVSACEQREVLTRRQWFSHDQIVLAPESCETEGMGYAGLNLFSLSLHEDDLEHVSRMADIDLVAVSQGDGAIFTPLPKSLAALRKVLWEVHQMGQGNPLTNWFSTAAETLKSALATCLATTVEHKGYPAPKRRDHAYNTVLKYMMGNLDTIISVKDLCREGNVSERTLLYIFRDRLDVTPKEFLQACKLRKVQHDLLSGEAKTVTDAATRWGFWHMGQFAADYRKMFGELPSATLKRRGQK